MEELAGRYGGWGSVAGKGAAPRGPTAEATGARWGEALKPQGCPGAPPGDKAALEGFLTS